MIVTETALLMVREEEGRFGEKEEKRKRGRRGRTEVGRRETDQKKKRKLRAHLEK